MYLLFFRASYDKRFAAIRTHGLSTLPPILRCFSRFIPNLQADPPFELDPPLDDLDSAELSLSPNLLASKARRRSSTPEEFATLEPPESAVGGGRVPSAQLPMLSPTFVEADIHHGSALPQPSKLSVQEQLADRQMQEPLMHFGTQHDAPGADSSSDGGSHAPPPIAVSLPISVHGRCRRVPCACLSSWLCPRLATSRFGPNSSLPSPARLALAPTSTDHAPAPVLDTDGRGSEGALTLRKRAVECQRHEQDRAWAGLACSI